MELLSEIIALDDASKKRVADAQALAESLRQKGLSDRKELEEQNEKKLAALREKSAEDTEKAAREAEKNADLYERKKRAELDELFSKNENRLIDEIVERIYTA